MFPRALMVGVTTVAAVGFVVVPVGPAWASPNARGTATCKIVTGSGTVSPGLSIAGGLSGMKINFTASFSSPVALFCNSAVTFPAGVKVLGGSLTGSGYYLPVAPQTRASSCANFHGTDMVGSITVTITWLTSGGPIANTVVTYTGLRNTVTGTPTDTITLRHPPAPGAAAKAGSFSIPPAGAPNLTRLVTTLHAPASCTAVAQTAFRITAGVVAM